MTHDELLAKIDDWFNQTAGVGLMTHYSTCIDSDCDCGLRDDRHALLHKALRAVVELHKPREGVWWISNPSLLACSVCEEWTYSDPEPAVYPCPTIQAIEKELK
jgi:hypothetical protein